MSDPSQPEESLTFGWGNLFNHRVMNVFTYGNKSKKRLDTCHKDMVLIMEESLTSSPIDFGISQGERSYDEQLGYYLEGKSKIDPRIPSQLARAKHVITKERPKSKAVDIYVWIPGRKDLAYDREILTFLAGHISGTAKRLYIEGQVTHLIRWGGDWDRDGDVLDDQKFDDLPHFELMEQI